jgi:hypothetical protein
VTSSNDPTIERGRLLGLAILGDWLPLIDGLIPGDRPMLRAARNAIALWRPGPFSAKWGPDDEAVARDLGERLDRTDEVLAPDVRATLAEIKTLVERRLGRIVLAGP